MNYDDLDEALEALDMQYWLDREGIKYRKTTGSHGLQLNLKDCPFCNGGNWKVYMNAETGLGNCFHGDCQRKFNKKSFIVQALQPMRFADVVKNIKETASEMGWLPTRRETTATFRPNGAKVILPQCTSLSETYKSGLRTPALTYLLRRGITPESLEYFQLADCQSGFYEYKNAYGFTARQTYDERIIIPIFDENGILVSFQGRDYSLRTDKRYLFPPGINATGSLLYNGWNASCYDQLILTEGVFDCIAVFQAITNDKNFKNIQVVATFGKHLSMGGEDSQLGALLRLKNKGLKVVTYMWDGESKAIKDAINSALELRRYGFVTRISYLPKDKDPNECSDSEIKNAFWAGSLVDKNSAAALLLKKI